MVAGAEDKEKTGDKARKTWGGLWVPAEKEGISKAAARIGLLVRWENNLTTLGSFCSWMRTVCKCKSKSRKVT